MFRDSHNIIPATMAVVLHTLVFGSLFVSFEFIQQKTPITPLAITATLVVEDELAPPPPPVQRMPEPEVVRQPEPEIVEPDPAEEERARLEEQERLREEQRERERISREQERERQEQAELEAERKAREEAELVRKRREQEEIRQRQVEEQRRRNEELRQQEEVMVAQAQQDQVNEEAERLAAQNSTEAQRYHASLRLRIQGFWSAPATAPDDLSCVATIRQQTNGVVLNVRVKSCNGDQFVERKIEAAVMLASPLPRPENPLHFVGEFDVIFKKKLQQ